MKIGISTAVINRGTTGIAHYVLGLVRALAVSGSRHEFTLFVLRGDRPLFRFAGRFMRIEEVDEEHRRPVASILWHQRVLPELARRLELDVLHVPSYRRMLWRRPCALVTTIHDAAPFRRPEEHDWMRRFYGRRIVPFLARRQHEIIAVSETTARDVTRFHGVSPQQVTTIPSGIDHDQFCGGSRNQAMEAVARMHGLSGSFFLYIARSEHPSTACVQLMEAFRRFKAETGSTCQLALAGKDWEQDPQVRSARLQLACFNDIRMLGPLEEGGFPVLFRAAEALLYPPLYEGFALLPLQAMACGCPVICSPEGGLAEAVGDAAAGAMAGDPSSWAAQMIRMIRAPEVRGLWCEAGRKRSLQFRWNKSAAAHLWIYARAIQRAHGEAVGPMVEDALSTLRV